MDAKGFRRAELAFDHFETINGRHFSVEFIGFGIDAADGSFAIQFSNSKDRASFEDAVANNPTVFDIVSIGSIQSIADGGSGTLNVNATAHGLAVGMTVTIEGTADYDDEYEVITVNSVNQFVINGTFTATDTGTFRRNGYKRISFDDINFRYMKISWTPNSVSEGKMKITKHQGQKKTIF